MQKTPRRRGPDGWLPNQHGAWAMLVAPWSLGLAWALGAGRFEPELLVLFGFWMVGYFAFFATTLWLKSRFKRRYVPAILTYGACAAALGVVVVSLRPQWWGWVLVYLPVCGFALWLSWLRHERDVASGFATIAAACLLPVVMGSDGPWRLGGLPVLAALALVCFGYFFGTVLYVKTILRERGKPVWVLASLGWHVLCTFAALWLPPPLPAGWLVGFFAVVALRALVVPVLGPMRGRRVDVRRVGIWEFVTTTALLAVLLPSLLG